MLPLLGNVIKLVTLPFGVAFFFEQDTDRVEPI